MLLDRGPNRLPVALQGRYLLMGDIKFFAMVKSYSRHLIVAIRATLQLRPILPRILRAEPPGKHEAQGEHANQ